MRPQIANAQDGTYVRAVARFEDAWELANMLCGRKVPMVAERKVRRLIVG